MYEMIYGNTGRNDEAVCIDMKSVLFQKLQSRTFVPKLKSLLNDTLQEGDKSFVFVGEVVVDKSEGYSVFGYNAKLEKDNRGGDYGHYVAVPLLSNDISGDISNISFLSEDGFVEYVNLKTLNDEKRFSIQPEAFEININAKKRIVNNLLEIFMRVRKKKVVTFSFDAEFVDVFNKRSVYVLQDIMKYLPFEMRKCVSFISHVASGQRLPDMINLAAYSKLSGFKPHDCIDLSESAPLDKDCAFFDYVEKVFSMDDSERNRYFMDVYRDIEIPSISKGIKSDIYLLDVHTKKLWMNGNLIEALDSIFGSFDDILSIYPAFVKIAHDRLTGNTEVADYIRKKLIAIKNTDELKSQYSVIKSVFEICNVEFDANIIDLFLECASNLIENSKGDDALIKTLSDVLSINSEILDRSVAKKHLLRVMNEKNNINSIYVFYLRVKDKLFIDSADLDIGLQDSTRALILRVTGRYTEATDRFSAFNRLYTEFVSSCTSVKPEMLERIFDEYRTKLGNEADSEAVRNGHAVLDEIKKGLPVFYSCPDIKEYIIKLAEIVNLNDEIRTQAAPVYSFMSDNSLKALYYDNLSLAQLKMFIAEVKPSVEKLSEALSGRTDSLYRFVFLFGSMLESINSSDNLTDVLFASQRVKNEFENDNFLSRMFEKYIGDAVCLWLGKHRKFSSISALKKSVSELNRCYDMTLSDSLISTFKKSLTESKGKNKKKQWLLITIIAIAVAIVLALGAFFAIRFFLSDKKNAGENNDTKVTDVIKDVEYIVSSEELSVVDQYIESFADAQLVIGTVSGITAESADNEVDTGISAYAVNVKKSFGNNLFSDEIIVTYNNDLNNYKGCQLEVAVDSGKDFALILHSTNDGTGKIYLEDVFPLPEILTEYDFNSKPTEDVTDIDFYSKLLKYIGEKNGIVKFDDSVGNSDTDNIKPETRSEENVNTIYDAVGTDEVLPEVEQEGSVTVSGATYSEGNFNNDYNVSGEYMGGQ